MVKRIAAAIVFAASLSGCQAPSAPVRNDALQGAARALEAFGAMPQDNAAQGEPAALAESSDDNAKPARDLLARLDRNAASERSGAAAIDAWFALYDDYRKLPTDQANKIADPRTGLSLSVLSLVAVMPGPADWTAMREQARARAARNARNSDEHAAASALVLLFDALLNDADAQGKTLAELRRAADGATTQRRERSVPLVEEWQRYLADEARIAQSPPAPVSNAAEQPEAPDQATASDAAAMHAAADPAEVARVVERLKHALSAGAADSATTAASFERAGNALQLAGIGVLEKRDDWIEQGSTQALNVLADTRAAAHATKRPERDGVDRDRILIGTFNALRDAGMMARAEQLLVDEIAAIGATCRTLGAQGCRGRFADPHAGSGDDLAPRLLLALYAGLGRDADVRMFVDRYPLWRQDDAARLSVDLNCCDVLQQPAVAIVRTLVAAGDKDRAAQLLKALVAQPDAATAETARLYGKIAGDESVGAVLLMRQHAAGPRNALAALAAAGAGLWPRAQELAIAARREQLHASWRAAMDEVLAGAADAANDAAGATRWRAALHAQSLAGDARRAQSLELVARAGEAYQRALADAQPGDCIESAALTLAHVRKDSAQTAALLRRISDNARHDETGGAVGCLKEDLRLAPQEFAVLRNALLASRGTPSVAAFAEDLPLLLFTLDQDCNEAARAEADRTCVDPAQLQRDARAAYAGIKSHLRPWDVDLVEILDGMVRRSGFASLYAAHPEAAPEPPAFEANAFERDDWPVRLVKLDPTALPTRVERKRDARGSYWRPVSHLVDYWVFAHGAAARLEPEASGLAYPLHAAGTVGQQQAPAASERAARESERAAPPDPALRANLLVASTEIVQMAVRLIEPGRHEP